LRQWGAAEYQLMNADALQILGVIPRPQVVIPLEEKEIDTLTAEEMRELLNRQKVRQAAIQFGTRMRPQQLSLTMLTP
jgi:hypothetical protein